MTTDHVRLIQLLCGPKRHAIMALPYLPGVTVGGDSDGDTVLTPETAIDFMRDTINRSLKRGVINPWCAICGAVADESWFYEDSVTKFATMDEAIPHLAMVALEMVKTRAFFGEISKRNN